MKIYHKEILQILIAPMCAGLLFLHSCRKEKPDCGDTSNIEKRVQFSNSLRSLVPHTGRDTLVFFNQYGDTIFLRGAGTKTTTINKGLQTTYPGIGSGGGECVGYIDFFIDFNEIKYIQDTLLSNSSILFPFNSIVMNADSAGEFVGITGSRIGVQISAKDLIFEAYYGQFVDQYYTHNIIINNRTYKCMSFNVRTANVFKSKLYFNHYQGIIQVIENDTIIWNRKFN